MIDIDALIAQLPELVITYGLKILFAILIFMVGKYISNVIRRLFVKFLERQKVDVTVIGFVGNIVWTIAITMTLIASLAQVGVQTAQLVAVVGAAGLAIGLALQGSLSNFAAGVLLVLFKPCRVGDYVEGAGVAGSVQQINIFSTTLVTPDNKVVVIPNSSLMNGSITNFSKMKQRRVDLVVGVAYDTDLRHAKQILAEVLANNALVLKDADNQVAVSELANSSVNFVVRPWVKTADYWTAYFEITEQIKLALDEAGVVIPYPQMDLHMKPMPAN